MTLDAVLHILIHSDASDWCRIPCGEPGGGPSYYYRIEDANWDGTNVQITGMHTSVATYRQDLSITMAWGMKAGKNSDRDEVRSSSSPDPRQGECYLLDLFYSGSLVFRTSYCDGEDGSCKLPLADAAKQVPQRYADVIRKLNELEGDDGFETSMKRSGTTVVDAAWPL
jgi:hypothetical protein